MVEKGDRPRYVFFGQECAQAILDYIETRPVYAPDELWLNRSFKPLTTSGIYHLLRKTAERAGVKRFNPHSFRHRLAKKLEAEKIPHKGDPRYHGLAVARYDPDLRRLFNRRTATAARALSEWRMRSKAAVFLQGILSGMPPIEPAQMGTAQGESGGSICY